MAINLKQINTSDSDNIKLDKVNYNFDQLVANGGGPQGPTGPKGDTGFQGVMGPRGFQGITGAQGPTGADAADIESFWTRIVGNINSLSTDTLFPKPSPSSLNPPVIAVGFLSTDPEYGVHQNISNGQAPYQWLINRKSHFYSNLRFKSSSVSDNWFDFIINYDQPSDKTTFRMTFAESGFDNPTRIIWSAENHIFKSNITGSNIISIGSNNIQFNRESQFNSRVKINQELYIENAGAGLNKIATSLDTNGQVVFKSIQELGGTVPYGTIISILPGVFADQSRFLNSEVIDLNQAPYTINDPIKIRVGSGVGDYEGWYICNGKTWIDDSTGQQYILPDLNSFSYTIADNQASIDINSQGSANVPNNAINLIGGADTSMTAAYTSSGVYNISSDVQSNDVDINTTSGSTYKIKRLPQIIYLGKSNLYWKDKGSDQAPSVLNTFYIDDLNNTESGCLTVSEPKTYTQEGSYSFTKIITVPSGYYFNSNVTAGAFTPTSQGYSVTNVTMGGGTYPSTITIEITVSSHAVANTDRYITWNSASVIAIIPVAIHYYLLAPPSYSTILDDGTDGTLNSTKTTNQLIGSTYSFPVTITADSGYYFTQNEVNNLTLNATTPSRIQLSNKVLVNPTTITATITDTSFPSGGGTTTIEWTGGAIVQPFVTFESNLSGSNTATLSPNTSGYNGAPASASSNSVNIIKINGSSNRYLHLNLSVTGPTGTGSGSLSITPFGSNPGSIISGSALSASTPTYNTISSSGSYYLTPGTYQITLSATISGVNNGVSYTFSSATVSYSTSLANTNPWEIASY
jgi:hypothetical protein